MNGTTGEPPSRRTLNDLKYGVWKATALKGALELDLFTLISQGHRELDDIVASTGWNARGTRILLDALCPLGLLSKRGSEYALTPVSDAFLVRGKPTYCGNWYLQTQLAWEARGRIAEGVRKGAPVGVDVSKPDAQDLWVSCEAPSAITWPIQARDAREMWAQLGLSAERRPGLHILDVACGSGVPSLVLAQADRTARVTALDYSRVLEEVTAGVAEAMGVRNQLRFLPGDLLETDFGIEQFDLVHFGLILYYFNRGKVTEILRKTHQALKSSGLVVVNTPIADEERYRAEIALMVALQLFIFAPDSEVYTFAEYAALLGKTGFADITKHSDFLISARKQ